MGNELIWTFLHTIFFLCQQSMALTCYECSEHFKESWEPRTCQINATAVPIRICNGEQGYCFVERETVKGIPTKITRNCISECFNGCKAISFGITKITCTSCCDQNNCNTGNGAHAIRHHGNKDSLLLLLLTNVAIYCFLFGRLV